MDNATKRPWKLKGRSLSLKSAEIITQDGKIIADTWDVEISEKEMFANARLIVKAVNEYDKNQDDLNRMAIDIHKQSILIDELVLIMKDAIKTFEPLCTIENCCSWVINDMKEALSKAGEYEK